jgi:hypothetical protein
MATEGGVRGRNGGGGLEGPRKIRPGARTASQCHELNRTLTVLHGSIGPSLEQCDRPLAVDPYVPKSLSECRLKVLHSIAGVREDAFAVVKVHEGLCRPRTWQAALHDCGPEYAGVWRQEDRYVIEGNNLLRHRSWNTMEQVTKTSRSERLKTWQRF